MMKLKKWFEKARSKSMLSALLTVSLTVASAAALSASTAKAAPTEEPVVLHATWKAEPGDVIGIYGGALGDPDAEVIAQPLGAGLALDPGNATVELEVIQAEDQVIHAALPETAPDDVYALWVQTAAGTSEPFWLNRAEPFWISDTTAYEGQTVRLFGRNLVDPGSGSAAGTAITLIETTTAVALSATVTAADAYTVDFEVPAAAVGGEYRIEVTSGVGGTYGKVLLEGDQTLAVVTANAHASALESALGLQVHWLTEIPHQQVFDADAYGASGDGVTDDTEAIQDALDAAEAAGGGIVELGEHDYLFTSLSIPARTILRGAGKSETRLVYSGEATPDYPRSILPREAFTNRNYGEARKLVFSDDPYAGIADLAIDSDAIRPSTDDRRRIHGYVVPVAFIGVARGGHDDYGSAPVPADSAGYLIKNVHIEASDGSAVAMYTTGIGVIEDSELLVTHSGVEASNRLTRFRGNEVRNMMRPGTYVSSGRVWYEDNTLTGVDYETYVPTVGFRWNEAGGAIEHRYADFPRAESYVAGNTTAGVFGSATGNEGEGLLWQGASRLIYAAVDAAGAQTLTDTDAAYTSGYVGRQVMINGGRGLGQHRIITAATSTELQLDEPWDIVPDATSTYTVDALTAHHNIVIGNHLAGQTNKGGIMFYTKDYDNIIEGNTLHNTGGIWMAANQNDDGKRADYSYFSYIADNTLSGSSKPGHGQGNTLAIGPGVDGGIVAAPAAGLPSTGIFGNEVRGNELTSIGTDVPYGSAYEARYVTRSGIVVSTPGEASYPMALGMIVADNRVRDAYAGVHLADSSYHTLLADNDFTGNGEAYDDTGSIGTALWQGGEALPYLTFAAARQQLDGSVWLDWPEVDMAASYTVARAVYADGPYAELATVTDLTYTDSAADALPYYYRVVAKDSSGTAGPPRVVEASFQPRLAGAYDTSGRAFELAVDGTTVYVADRDSLQILDASDPADIQPLSTIAIAVSNLALDGDTLYATGGGKLYAIDVSDPVDPQTLGSLTVSNASDIRIQGNLAYVARGTNGLGIYDVSDPASIASVRTLSGLGNVGSLHIAGDYAYVAGGTAGLSIVDITSPSAAAVIGTYTSVISARHIAVRDDYAYVANSTNTGDGGLLVLDVSDKMSPAYVSQLDTDSATVSVELVGPYALLGGYRNQLVYARIADPAAPVQVGATGTPSNSAFDTVTVGDRVYLANSNAGIKVFTVN
ncbi:hypothetical protein IDH44_00505 [Paenibacillus sp. IB182496]|uniref:Rhamnogalacturonase A/B/Epimerase-like pectate lyase domain-containing protein n=1 Tax=Paenibacillus sabuli TaxID=2772509 RepID=A0A927BQE7_9BACL|nr:glycosyl hydrolase family 28-related protein [Paenibacillus sabuli]MBD2843654.1 hypothetical protein [Paenibacillus sabuli]